MATDTHKPGPQGHFITFEGIDGCGKTTQAKRLAAYLREQGRSVLETREPGGTAIGRALRAVLLDGRNTALVPQCELLLYLADRTQHLAEVIGPALEGGETVICDRFHDATVAYQQHGRGLDLTLLEGFIAREVLVRRPQLTFWLDVPVEEAYRRMAGRNNPEAGSPPPPASGDETRLDTAGAAFHERVRAGYESLWRAEPSRIVRIDADRPVEAVAAEIRNRFEERHGL